MRVLNVGGGGSRNLPSQYEGWTQLLLDIDASVRPDLCMDAKDLLTSTEAECFDAVFCSHNLEHFYKHDVSTVLKGFHHVLNNDGFAEIHVPNLKQLFSDMQARSLCVDDVWYRTGSGAPITFHDVLYGWSAAMSAGNLYYAHKCGFTATSLSAAIAAAGFGSVFVQEQGANLKAVAYKKEGVKWPQ